MKDTERVWVEMLKIEAFKEEEHEKGKNSCGKAATCGFPLYPCNYGKSIHINI